MRVSIVIPTFNRPHLLTRAIESALKQDYAPFEIIVINDGHDPVTYQSNKVRIYSSEGIGPVKARNMAVSKCAYSSEAVCFLDDDDELLPNHLSSLVPLIEKGAKFAFSRALYRYPTFETTDPEPKNPGVKGYYNPNALLDQNIAPISSFLFRKDAFEQIEGFDPNVERLEDWDLWGRMFIAYGPPSFTDQITNVIYKNHGINQSDHNQFAYSLMCCWRDHVSDRLRILAKNKRGVLLPSEKISFGPPKVAVVMPVYNAMKYLKQAIESILTQTFKDFEILAIDDASTDDSLKYLSSMSIRTKKLRVFRNEQRLGVAKTLNKGVLFAGSPLIARMDADDISLKERLAKQVEFMDNNSVVSLVGSWFWSMDEDMKQVIWDNKTEQTHEEICKALVDRCCMGHPTMMIRRKVFETIGGYDETPETRHVEDYDFWGRAIKKFRLANIPERLLKHRVHKNQVTGENKEEVLKNFEFVRSKIRKELSS